MQQKEQAEMEQESSRFGVLLVGDGAQFARADSDPPPPGPEGEPVHVERVAQLPEATATLAREGYRFKLAIFSDQSGSEQDGWDALLDDAALRPWLVYAMSLDVLPADSREKALNLNNVATWKEGELGGELWEILSKYSTLFASLPRPPYPPNAVRLLREAGPLLFSLCLTERPWELECDAVVVPVWPTGTLGSFGESWDSSSTSTISETLQQRASMTVSSAELLEQEAPRFDPDPYTVVGIDGSASRTLRLLFATAGQPPVSTVQSVAANLSALRRATGEPGIQTLLLPLAGTGSGGQDVEEILRGVVDGFDPHWQLGDLKHVIVPIQNAQLFAALDLRQPPAPVKSQKFENDEPRGEDRLGIEAEVKALADSIALGEMTPPLVVGVLGGWGTGKSFVLHLLSERLREIRCWDVSDDQLRANFPFVGHPYLVHFDAWTYAKENLWASLMHTILEQMNQQLQLERHVENKQPGALLRGLDIWTLIRALKTSELNALGEDLGQELLGSLESWQFDEHLVEELWRGLRREHERQRALLQEATDALDKTRASYSERLLKVESELQSQRLTFDDDLADSERQATADLEAELQKKRDALKSQETLIREQFRQEHDASSEAWQATHQRLVRTFGKDLLERTTKELPPDARHSGSALLDLGSELRRWRHLPGTWRQSLNPAHVLYLLVAIGAVPLVWTLTNQWLEDLWSLTASLLTCLGGAAGSIRTALASARERLEEERSRFQEDLTECRHRLEERLEHELNLKLADSRQRISELEQQRARLAEGARAKARRAAAQREAALEVLHRQLERERDERIEAIERRIEQHQALVDQDPRGPTVHELIQERLRSGQYAQHLGLVHHVQQDLMQLSQALLPRDDDKEPQPHFPRGKPRIILVIDDLDRCPPDDVVRVLEAAQLLVKTELFVVVLAMDVRYVTRSLEKHYKDILVSDGVPSGLDYIEKIVQVPYRVPDIEPSAFRPFLSAQMQLIEEKKTTQTTQDDTQETDDNQPQAKKTVFRSSKTAADLDRQALPDSVLKFSSEELNLLDICCKAVEISPRSTKRLVNVFKLMKIIWHHRGARDEPSLDVKHSIALLLVLAARQPVIMRDVLRDLDGFLRRDEPEILERGLGRLLSERITKARTEDNKRAVEHLAAVVTQNDLVPGNLKLCDIKLPNLRLVRSFSFVGETVEEIDITASAESESSQTEENPSTVPVPHAGDGFDGETGVNDGLSVIDIKGIGPRYTDLLRRHAVRTVSEFLTLSASDIALMLPVSEERAQDLLDAARRLLGP